MVFPSHHSIDHWLKPSMTRLWSQLTITVGDPGGIYYPHIPVVSRNATQAMTDEVLKNAQTECKVEFLSMSGKIADFSTHVVSGNVGKRHSWVLMILKSYHMETFQCPMPKTMGSTYLNTQSHKDKEEHKPKLIWWNLLSQFIFMKDSQSIPDRIFWWENCNLVVEIYDSLFPF